MGVVVPGEEPLTERTGVLDEVEARRKVGLVMSRCLGIFDPAVALEIAMLAGVGHP
jgi:hypothetical protein